MATTQTQLKEKIARVSASEIKSKQELFGLLRNCFTNMQELLAQLPQDEQDQILIVLIDELLEVERKFTFEIADRIIASKARVPGQNYVPTHNTFATQLEKHFKMCLGGFHRGQ